MALEITGRPPQPRVLDLGAANTWRKVTTTQARVSFESQVNASIVAFGDPASGLVDGAPVTGAVVDIVELPVGVTRVLSASGNDGIRASATWYVASPTINTKVLIVGEGAK